MTATTNPVAIVDQGTLGLLGATAGITIGATIAIDVLIGVLGLPEKLEGLKGAPGMASAVTYHVLATRRRGTGLVPGTIVPFSGFELAWPVVAVLGGLTILGSAQLGSFIGALLTGTIEGGIGASVVTAVFVSYLAGRWIGMRADKRAITAAVVAVVIARVLGTVIDWILLPPEFRDELGMTIGAIPILVAVGVVTWGIPAVLGATRGRAAREGAYLTFLMGRVNPKVRSTVLEIVFEESTRSSVGPMAAGAPSQPAAR